MSVMEPELYAVLDTNLRTIYGIVAGVSEHDVYCKVISDPVGLLFDGRRGAREVKPRRVAELIGEVWYEVASDVPSAGWSGGDVQDTDSVSRRFARPLPGHGLWSVFEVAWYVADDTGETPAVRRGRWLERQNTFTICADLRDVGGTECWSDTMYLTETQWPAEEASLALAAQAFNLAAELDWDGKRF
jgi:hypothetical protein